MLCTYIHVFCMLMSEMSTSKEINLNGSAYINYIGKLASILLAELCPPQTRMLEP